MEPLLKFWIGFLVSHGEDQWVWVGPCLQVRSEVVPKFLNGLSSIVDKVSIVGAEQPARKDGPVGVWNPRNVVEEKVFIVRRVLSSFLQVLIVGCASATASTCSG